MDPPKIGKCLLKETGPSVMVSGPATGCRFFSPMRTVSWYQAQGHLFKPVEFESVEALSETKWDEIFVGDDFERLFFWLGNKKGWFPILCVPLFLLVFFVGLLSKPLLEPFTAFMVLSHFSCCSAFSFLSSCQSQVHS